MCVVVMCFGSDDYYFSFIGWKHVLRVKKNRIRGRWRSVCSVLGRGSRLRSAHESKRSVKDKVSGGPASPLLPSNGRYPCRGRSTTHSLSFTWRVLRSESFFAAIAKSGTFFLGPSTAHSVPLRLRLLYLHPLLFKASNLSPEYDRFKFIFFFNEPVIRK